MHQAPVPPNTVPTGPPAPVSDADSSDFKRNVDRNIDIRWMLGVLLVPVLPGAYAAVEHIKQGQPLEAVVTAATTAVVVLLLSLGCLVGAWAILRLR